MGVRGREEEQFLVGAALGPVICSQLPMTGNHALSIRTNWI